MSALGGEPTFAEATVNGQFPPSPGGGDLLPLACNRVAQSSILGLQSGDLVLDSGQSFAHHLDLLLLLLNCLDDGRGQLAVGNAIGAIPVVLPLDQSEPMLGFRSLDCIVQRCR